MDPDQNRPDFSSPLKSGVKTSPLGPEGIFKQEEPREETRGAAAMALEFLVNMKEKVTCAICLELLTEPLSLNCGHSFCQACITDNKKPEIGPGGESSCPVCGVRYSFGSLWLNQHLANIVERVKEVKLSPEERQMKDLCLSHGERLQLFCKEDRKAICQFCEWSQEHRGHQIFLMEEVVKEYQEKLQTTLDRLRKEHQEAEKLGADIREERTSWKNQIQTEKQRIQTEFNQLRSILDSEEQRELQKLEEEETKTLHDLAEAENELVQQSQLLEELISDLERRSEWSALELLQDTSGIMKWSEVWTLKKPKTISKKLKHGFHAPDLSGMLHTFKELTCVQYYWVDMTFDPFNLNLNLTLSEDHRQLASVPIWPMKYYNYGVLGSQYFSSGKHYWEIDVSKKTAWILGIYYRKRSCNKKFGVRRDTIYQKAFGNKKFGVRPDTLCQKAYSRFRPENGYWVVGLQNESEYNAFEDSATSDPKILTLSVAVPPHRVGVFLDYEASTVSFFNVTNHGSLIYKFSKCHFSQTVYPYFNPWNCLVPMALCPPSS